MYCSSLRAIGDTLISCLPSMQKQNLRLFRTVAVLWLLAANAALNAEVETKLIRTNLNLQSWLDALNFMHADFNRITNNTESQVYVQITPRTQHLTVSLLHSYNTSVQTAKQDASFVITFSSCYFIKSHRWIRQILAAAMESLGQGCITQYWQHSGVPRWCGASAGDCRL